MIASLIGLALLILLVSLLLAPIEALGWWAGWFGEGLDEPDETDLADYRAAGQSEDPRLYVVYLDGIAKAVHENYDEVQVLVDQLSAGLPEAVVLGDIMPYSPRNLGLTQDRPFARFWRRMLNLKLADGNSLLAFSINVRNLLQVLVAADRRYGPVYGRAEAQVILNSLVKAGYDLVVRKPIVIVGYSGGAQIGLVATPFLKRALGTRITMVSLAGVFASGPGMDDLEHFYNLEGSLDNVTAYGRVLFPGRWRVWRGSQWNRLKAARKVTHVPLGAMKHHGRGGYLDGESLLDGRDHRTSTGERLVDVIRGIGLDA